MKTQFFKFCLLFLLISYENVMVRASEKAEEVYSGENYSVYSSDDCSFEDGDGLAQFLIFFYLFST
jgi:hypothetical protein